jgi:ribosomal-protein-alanine N-acetyltransferase
MILVALTQGVGHAEHTCKSIFSKPSENWLQSKSVLFLMLNTSRILLRGVEKSDLNSTYLSWINDPLVNQYLENRFFPQTLDTLYTYWKDHHNDQNSPWFAICLKKNGKHIGNIKLGPIEWIHRKADISLFIGDTNSWGKGYASEAIALLRDWSFVELNIEKLKAGIYAGNVASRRAFEKCGFTIEGILCSEVSYHGNRIDLWLMGLSRSKWKLIK